MPISTGFSEKRTVGGSTIDVKGAFTYVSWNADESGKKYIVANTNGLQKALWEFYEVVPGEWMTDQIKSNLKLVNGNYMCIRDRTSTEPVTAATKRKTTKIKLKGIKFRADQVLKNEICLLYTSSYCLILI